MGLFCKGLHCAGCGKGVPLSIVVVLVLIVSQAGSAISGALEGWLIAIAASIVFGVIGTPIVLWAILRNKPVIGGRWDGPTMAEVKAEAELPLWAQRANIEGDNLFQRIPVEQDNGLRA